MSVDEEHLRNLVRAEVESALAYYVQDDQLKNSYLSVPEAAEYLRCSRQRIYDLLSSRRLDGYRDGRRVLFSRDELDRYLRR